MDKENKSKILNSLKVKDQLNPAFFDLSQQMIPEVRKKLLGIAYAFYDFIDIDNVPIDDVVLVGSMANYNWSDFSDADVHIRVPYDVISTDKELTKELMFTKKSLWEERHNFKIEETEIELFIEDSDANELKSTGIYSILKDRWLLEPSKSMFSNKDINFGRISKLLDKVSSIYNKMGNSYSKGDNLGLSDDVDDLLNTVYKMREHGLSTGGESSEENLAFKALRRGKILSNLKKMRSGDLDKRFRSKKPRNTKPKDDGFEDLSKKKKKKKDDENLTTGGGRYIINGRRYRSLRTAEKEVGVPKSTIQYRVKSSNYPNFRELNTGVNG